MKEIFDKTIEWRRRKKGEPVVDYVRGVGYYLNDKELKRDKHEILLHNGKVMMAKLVNYEFSKERKNQVVRAEYQFLGYKGERSFSDLSLFEYLKAHQVL